MRHVRVINKSRDSVLGAHVGIADRWWSRVRGFLGRPAPNHGEGILLSPCRAVHMVGVSFPLDVLFIDRHGRVVAAYESLEPGSRTSYHMNAEYALEVPVGTIAATATTKQDLLAWTPGADEDAMNGGSPFPRAAKSWRTEHGMRAMKGTEAESA